MQAGPWGWGDKACLQGEQTHPYGCTVRRRRVVNWAMREMIQITKNSHTHAPIVNAPAKPSIQRMKNTTNSSQSIENLRSVSIVSLLSKVIKAVRSLCPQEPADVVYAIIITDDRCSPFVSNQVELLARSSSAKEALTREELDRLLPLPGLESATSKTALKRR